MDTNTAARLSAVRHLARSGEARSIRKEAMLTQMEVARAIGVSGFTISCWERGLQLPTGRAAIAYAELLAVVSRGDPDPSDLMTTTMELLQTTEGDDGQAA
jgi:DNA-binding transcriptional regulator YiaG